MGLNLKDEQTVALVAEVAARLGLTKTGAVRALARDKLAELDRASDAERGAREREVEEWLQRDVWPHVPRAYVTKADVEAILGYNEMFRE